MCGRSRTGGMWKMASGTALVEHQVYDRHNAANSDSYHRSLLAKHFRLVMKKGRSRWSGGCYSPLRGINYPKPKRPVNDNRIFEHGFPATCCRP